MMCPTCGSPVRDLVVVAMGFLYPYETGWFVKRRHCLDPWHLRPTEEPEHG